MNVYLEAFAAFILTGRTGNALWRRQELMLLYFPVAAAEGAQRSVSAAEHGLYRGHYSSATGFSCRRVSSLLQ